MKLAIIGNSCSAIELIREIGRQHKSTIEILFFDSPKHKEDISKTNCPLHLMNTPTAELGDFYDWLIEKPNLWQDLHPFLKDLEVTRHSFLPIMVHHRYLEDLKGSLSATAEWIHDPVLSIQMGLKNRMEIHTAKKTYLVDKAILNLKVPATRPLQTFSPTEMYLPTIGPKLTSMPEAKCFIQSLPPSANVGIIGSGIMMLNVLATLKWVQYTGKITIFSKSGHLPQPHNPYEEVNLKFPPIDNLPTTAKELFKFILNFCREVEQKNGNWRQVIDTFSEILPTLWKKLLFKEQSRALRHLYSLWKSHRHRAPPDTLAIFHQFQYAGRLEFIPVSAQGAHVNGEKKISVTFHTKRKQSNLKVDALINCRGPNYHIHQHPSPLIQSLLKLFIAQPDPLELGLAINENGALIGPLQDHLFAMGPLVFGSLIETTQEDQNRRIATALVTKNRKGR